MSTLIGTFTDPSNTVERRRERLVAASRREWPEYPAKDLEPVGRFVCDKGSGNLFLPVLGAVLADDTFGTGAPKVDAFYIAASGEPIYLERSQSPGTLDELRQQEAAKEAAKEAAERDREQKHAAFLASQPLRTVTLAELESNPQQVPTLRQAVRELHNLGGHVEADGPDLRIRVPERLAEDPNVADATRQALPRLVRVIAAGRNTILAEIAKGGKTPLADRLPDRHVGAAGSLA